MGGAPTLRLSDGEPTLTDNQNYIVDAGFGPIDDPAGLSTRLDSIAGTVDNGIFFGMATSVLVQSEGGDPENAERVKAMLALSRI